MGPRPARAWCGVAGAAVGTPGRHPLYRLPDRCRGFIPYLGATLAGAAAVLVTLVSNNLTDAR